MPSIVEGVVFAHVVTSYEVYERLVDLDERIAIRWLMPGKPGAPELQPGKTEQRVWVRPNNSTNIKILGGGHLVRQLLMSLIFGPTLKQQQHRYLKKRHRNWVCVFFFKLLLCLIWNDILF